MAPKSKDLPPASRPATRAKNKDVHPAFDTGHRKPWGTRRTSTQIAEAQEKEDSAKRQAVVEQKRLTDKVAEIEDRQREEDLQYASQANHPVDAVVLNAVDEMGEEQEEEEQGEDDGGDSECDPSFGEEDANVYTGSDSDDSDDDEESSAPRGRPKKTKTRRDDISAQRRTIAQSGTPKITNLKRKASPKQKAAKKTKKSKKSGLAPVPRRGTSSASGRSSRMAVDTEDDNDNMVRPGGPALDDDPHEYVEVGKKKKKHGKPAQSDYIAISRPPKAPTLKDLRNGATKWTLDHLPEGARAKFRELMTPLAYVHMGQHPDPWGNFTDDETQSLIVKDFRIATTVSRTFRGRAWIEEQIKREEEQEAKDSEGTDDPDADPAFTADGSFNFKTPEGIAAFVKFFTTEVNHTCPFHWKRWGGGVEKEGLFENEIILYTFAYHIMTIVHLPSNIFPDSDYKHPIGALILCIQAVDRALRTWSTGEYIAPTGKSSSNFSKDHYADTTKMVSGQYKKHKRSGKFVPTIENFDDAQWQSFFNITEKFVDRTQKPSRSRSSSMDVDRLVIESDEEENFVLTADVQVRA
ncbi:hypothetical protein B0H13DRAFT_2453007 [Mycena leptocephala]|nr:hypothetical protein B0H13DRAFT_2453007 [Mycena leptocephala]